MRKKTLLEDIRQNPERIYRTPADVLRDRRFADMERLEILCAWRDRRGDTAGIGAAIQELEQRLALAADDHAAQ